MTIIDFGIKDFDEILILQEAISEDIRRGLRENCCLIGEHYNVITLGRRPNQKSNLKLQDCNLNNIKIRKISRGGFATYHGPGQIVAYPLINLTKYGLSIRSYISQLEQIIINILEEFNIKAVKKTGYIGIWVEDAKIASIGVGVKRGISLHGFAINICTDLDYFSYIVPCGIKNLKMTSIEKVLNREVSLKKVKKICKLKILEYYNDI